MRGFQEVEKPQSNAPTVPRESIKLFLTIAAMGEFDLMLIYICAALIQSIYLDWVVNIKPPKDIKKAASTSFINELLEMARAEDESSKQEKSSKVEEPHDFKQSLLAARKKITHREEKKNEADKNNNKTVQQADVGTNNASNNSNASSPKSTSVLSAPSKLEKTSSVTSVTSESGKGGNEEIAPFVKEVRKLLKSA